MIRTPVASQTALAIAGATMPMPASPTALAENGAGPTVDVSNEMTRGGTSRSITISVSAGIEELVKGRSLDRKNYLKENEPGDYSRRFSPIILISSLD